MFRVTVAEIRSVSLILALMWAGFFVDWFLPLEHFGLRPRTVIGLAGVVTMPFVHLGLGHILGNSIPLLVLLSLLALSSDDTMPVVTAIVLLGGALLWIFGRSAVHVGASSLVFGLATYLVVAGYRARSFGGLAIAALTIALYGGNLLLGVLPFSPGVSWDGHLTGALAGAVVAVNGQKRTGTSR